jgi:hypothetical protein
MLKWLVKVPIIKEDNRQNCMKYLYHSDLMPETVAEEFQIFL